MEEKHKEISQNKNRLKYLKFSLQGNLFKAQRGGAHVQRKYTIGDTQPKLI